MYDFIPDKIDYIKLNEYILSYYYIKAKWFFGNYKSHNYELGIDGKLMTYTLTIGGKSPWGGGILGPPLLNFFIN